MVYVYEISGAPVSWKSHKGTGKRSYSPRIKEKEVAQWQLKMQHKQKPLITGAVRVDFFFEIIRIEAVRQGFGQADVDVRAVGGHHLHAPLPVIVAVVILRPGKSARHRVMRKAGPPQLW